MDEHDQLEQIDVQDYPTNSVLHGTVTSVTTGERQEFFEDSDYGDPEDTLVQLEIEAKSDDGETYNVREYMRRHDTVTNRQQLGQYIERYGSPSVGQEVKVDFDADGQASVIL